ncbi:MAG: hypothetical protein EXX96DRAFT_621440 [Benjaminiella poitrasii]|nr:MAG: hypothetical protein EXX96DRAFT_621440 [Benjaminiella poitrasii]
MSAAVKAMKLAELYSSDSSNSSSISSISSISTSASTKQKLVIKKQKRKTVKMNENNAKLNYLPCRVCSGSNSLEGLYHCQGCGMTVHNGAATTCSTITEDLFEFGDVSLPSGFMVPQL